MNADLMRLWDGRTYLVGAADLIRIPRRAYGHLAIPSRRFSVAARSQSWCSRIR